MTYHFGRTLSLKLLLRAADVDFQTAAWITTVLCSLDDEIRSHDRSVTKCAWIPSCLFSFTYISTGKWLSRHVSSACLSLVLSILSSHLETGRCFWCFGRICKTEGARYSWWTWKEWLEWRSNHSIWHRAYHRITYLICVESKQVWIINQEKWRHHPSDEPPIAPIAPGRTRFGRC